MSRGNEDSALSEAFPSKGLEQENSSRSRQFVAMSWISQSVMITENVVMMRNLSLYIRRIAFIISSDVYSNSWTRLLFLRTKD